MPIRYLLVCLACVLLSPFNAAALELEDLRLPMTRSEADATLSKDYQYRVLQDVSIRRSWDDGNRKVSIDFTPSNDKAVLITIDYKKPVTATVANRDAEAMAGGKLGKWRKGKTKKMEEIGLKKAQFVRTEQGGFIFRERAKKGKYSRLAYFASTPKDNRWELTEFDDRRRVTALGSTAGGEGIDYLRKDEERRRKTPAKPRPAKRPTAIAAVTPAPGKVTAPATDEFEDTSAAAEEEEEAVEEEPLAAQENDWLSTLKPMHYGIVGGVLLLLIIIRNVCKRNDAKRRASIAASIINQSKAQAKAKDKDEK